MLNSNNNPYSNTELISLLNTVLDVDHCGIIVINTEGIILFVNKAFAENLEKSPGDIIGIHIDDAYVNSDPSKMPDVIRTGQAVIGYAFNLNGRHVVANSYPIYENGKIVGALGKLIFKDIEELNTIYSKINKDKIIKKENNCCSKKYDIDDLIGLSPQMLDLKESIVKIAPRNSTVLIRGESGTGKELFAHAVHNSSHRRNNPFIKVNCAAIPENLLESELFGYTEGAFTGARKGGQKGKFELANKGTIFLDEIGDMSFHMQAKLLRVLQEKEIEPLGSNQTKPIDVRIIAATNVNLEELIKYGKFRTDLYYRLNVVSLHIPALRERKEDINILIQYFVRKFNELFSLNVKGVSAEVVELFHRYNWPGNVREFENIMEQAFNFVDGKIISLQHIPKYLVNLNYQEEEIGYNELAFTTQKYSHWDSTNNNNSNNSNNIDSSNLEKEKIIDKQSLVEMVDSAEKKMILNAIAESNGNKSKAANLLGISRSGLYKKLVKYDINI